jgi:hypothetical protein
LATWIKSAGHIQGLDDSGKNGDFETGLGLLENIGSVEFVVLDQVVFILFDFMPSRVGFDQFFIG